VNRARRSGRNRGALTGFVTLALLTGGSDALAKPPPKVDDFSAVAQYREAIPTSRGPVVVGPNAEEPQVRPLARPLLERIRSRAGERAGLLEKATSSSAYGAPQRSLPALATPSAATGGAETRGLLADLVDRRVLGLVAAMVATSLVAAALGLAQRRPNAARTDQRDAASRE
jgi:hypothetical protein